MANAETPIDRPHLGQSHLHSTPQGESEAPADDHSALADQKHSVSGRYARFALACVLLAFVGLSLVAALKTPSGGPDDEPSHVQNVETLAAGHWYGMHLGPVRIVHVNGEQFNVGASSGLEAHQPPLYYLTLAGWQRMFGLPVGTPQSFGYSFTFTSEPPNHLLLWLRIPNILLGALAIFFTFLATRVVARDAWTPVVAASLMAFVPRFVFLSAYVTNDNLVNLLAAVLTYLALRYTQSPTRWRIALIGGIVGLLTATKLSALPLGLIVLVLAWMQREWLKRAEYIALGIAASLVASGWYLIQNTVRYGSPLASGTTRHYLAQIQGTGLAYGVEYKVTDPLKLVFDAVPLKVFNAFWYGYVVVDPVFHNWSVPLPVNLLFWTALAFALVGLVGRHISSRALVVLGVLAATGFLSVWIVAFQTKTYDPRLALAGMPALACLAALGLERWKVRIRFLFPMVLLGATLVAIQQNLVHW